MPVSGKNRIMIFGPKDDGTYVLGFRTAAGESLALSIPRTETAVIRHFQERMPYGLFVPEVPSQYLVPRAAPAAIPKAGSACRDVYRGAYCVDQRER
jgi:hypothetical protein